VLHQGASRRKVKNYDTCIKEVNGRFAFGFDQGTQAFPSKLLDTLLYLHFITQGIMDIGRPQTLYSEYIGFFFAKG
jgi:hypothetical protein